MAGRSFDDFDPFAKDYRDIHSRNIKISGADSYYFAEMKVKLLRDHEDNVQLKVLDVGCGDGATELYMNKYFPSWNINAIDISEKSINEAQARNIVNCDFRTYDGHQIPFADESFDVVFMAGVLHHIDFSKHKEIVGEIHRVLKKGGRFYLIEHNPLNPATKHLVNTCEFDKNARLLKISYTIKLLVSGGFRICRKNFIIFFPRNGFLSRFIFLEKYLYRLPLGGQYYIRSVKR
jgi:ubiquinone/menaquinone biosynthesis C-methylase UbiE